MKKICIVLAVLLGVSSLLFVGASAAGVEDLLGFYQGSCSTQQVDMGLSLSVLDTQRLAQDDALLRSFSALTGGELSVESLRSAVAAHGETYIALLYFYPKSVAESGSGLYTMSVEQGDSGYELTGKAWLWQGGGAFMDLMNLSLKDGKLSGDVFGEYSFLFWTRYGDVGDVSATRETGNRIYFRDAAVTMEQYRKGNLSMELRDERGYPVTGDVPLTWRSGDEDVIQLTEQGRLSAVGVGSAVVYAGLENGREAACTVTVTKAQPPVSLEVTTELVSEITYYQQGENRVPQFAPNYLVTVKLTNATQETMTGVEVALQGLSLYEGEATAMSFEALSPGDSREVTWSVVIAANRETGSEAPFTLAVESEEFAAVTHEQVITVAPFSGTDNRLVPDQDMWFFTNTGSVFKNGNTLPDGYLDALSNVDRVRVEDYLSGGWQGSGYGMAAVAALMKVGQLDPADYRDGAGHLVHLPSPRDDVGVSQLICEYQLSQLLNRERLEAQLAVSETERLQGLVTAADMVKFGGMPVVVSLWYQEEGQVKSHALVAYDVEYGEYSRKDAVTGEKEVFDKRIIVYDPSVSTVAYLYVNADHSKWVIDGYCQNITAQDGQLRYDGEGYLVYADTPEALALEGEGTDQRVRLESPVGELEITTDQERYQVSGMNAAGEPLSYLFGNGVCYVPGVTDMLTVVPQGAAALTCGYPGMSLSVAADSGKSVTFGASGRIRLDCPSGAFTLGAVFDQGYGEKGWYAFTLTGTGTGEVTLVREADGRIRISGGLDGARLQATGTEAFSQVITTDAAEVMLVEEHGSLVLYADPDGDGVWDTPADQVVTPEPQPEEPQEQPAEGEKKSSGHAGTVVAVVLVILLLAGAGVGVFLLMKNGILTIQINTKRKK